MHKVSIVLPAYNEAARLENAVETVEKFLREMDYDYEIIIAEDGSTDGTDKIANHLEKSNERIRHLHSEERLGRGKALTNAFLSADGDIVVYLDVDLSTDMKHLRELIDSIAVEGYDFATGSRLMRESIRERSFKRDFASKAFNFLVRIFLGSKLHDHQCGFKSFKKSSFSDIYDKIKDNHWFWDTELLVLAQRMGYKVKEFPVEWRQSGETKVRFTKDVLYMFSQILRMWGDEVKTSRKFFTASILLAVTIIASLIMYVGAENIIARLSTANLPLIGFAVLIYALSYAIRGERYRYIISKLGYDTSTIFSSESVAISQTVNVITPVRVGDFARAYLFKIKDIPFTTSFSGLAVERVFDVLAVVIFSFYGMLAVSNVQYASFPFYALILMAGVIAVAIILSRMENILGKIMRDFKDLIKTRSSIVILITSLLVWTSDILVTHFIMLSFGVSILPLVVLAVSIANISKIIPLTPGGIGIYEGFMTGILALSVDRDIALTTSLIDHALKNVITLLLGVIALTALNVRLKDLRKT
ncbi:MAG TPA: flippase-like domain-containing protein [Archaeoglobaceae archaeon]|nr:flippase-like domain-containing protein [Archaeoglobaceae archaeon]